MDRPRKIAFIDTETTGLSHLNRPWEIAVILRETQFIEAPDLATAGTRYIESRAVDTEHLFQVEYRPSTLPDGTSRQALDIGRWRERGWGISGDHYRESLIDQGVLTAFGPEWTIAQSAHELLQGATVVGVGVHFDVETLGRMFLRHGLDWHPWHYGIVDLKAAGWGHLRGQAQQAYIETPEGDWDRIPIKSETVGSFFTDPPTDEERHTALGDARWARRWFDAL